MARKKLSKKTQKKILVNTIRIFLENKNKSMDSRLLYQKLTDYIEHRSPKLLYRYLKRADWFCADETKKKHFLIKPELYEKLYDEMSLDNKIWTASYEAVFYSLEETLGKCNIISSKENGFIVSFF